MVIEWRATIRALLLWIAAGLFAGCAQEAPRKIQFLERVEVLAVDLDNRVYGSFVIRAGTVLETHTKEPFTYVEPTREEPEALPGMRARPNDKTRRNRNVALLGLRVPPSGFTAEPTASPNED